MRYPPINSRFPYLWHGGDYNPDQWLDHPEIIDEDFRLMKLAGINSLSLGIFAWAALEPAEGRYTFDWLDRLMDRCAEERLAVVLATPTGGKPNWLAQKYPEVRRCRPNGEREPQGLRHNHCPTSPVYRDKAAAIDRQIASRYGRHPALALWHLSNEYSGECYCPLCKDAFRHWLQARYGSLDALNAAWWTGFWSHTYTDWSQIDWIDPSIHGLALDWKRFVSDQTADFMAGEIAALREHAPDVPVSTNLMGFFEQLNYWKLAPHLDVISWDNYPALHERADQARTASYVSMVHDLNRALGGGKPFMIMESSPSATNWMRVNKLLRPGMHVLKSVQAIAHGADTVQYFQFRKGRGGSEKFHGAVVDHVGHESTRVFAEVAEVGTLLPKLEPVVGCPHPVEVGLILDWENWWALAAAQGPSDAAKDYRGWCHAHYHPLWQLGIAADIIDMEQDFAPYKLLIAPSLYMLRPGVAERITEFVRAGGSFVATYLTGIVDEHDLVFTGGWPGPLSDMLGIWSEEIDYLYEDEHNVLVPAPGNDLGLAREARLAACCDLVHLRGAAALAAYGDDFYAGRPALTVNRYGAGAAYYLAAQPDHAFLADFYAALAARLNLRRALDVALPAGVTAQVRSDGETDYVFVLNFNPTPCALELPAGSYADLLSGEPVGSTLHVPARGLRVLTTHREGSA